MIKNMSDMRINMAMYMMNMTIKMQDNMQDMQNTTENMRNIKQNMLYIAKNMSMIKGASAALRLAQHGQIYCVTVSRDDSDPPVLGSARLEASVRLR